MVVINSPYHYKKTCSWQSTCQQEVLNSEIWLKRTSSISTVLKLMKKQLELVITSLLKGLQKKELPCIQVSMSFNVNNFLNTLIACQTKISMGLERKTKLSAEIETIDKKIKEMRDQTSSSIYKENFSSKILLLVFY